jgi:starvation-inducible DNA-binding protein
MTHRTKIDLTDNVREKAIALLNARLADCIDLKLQVKQAHWNVKGPSFIALHELFDEIAGRVEEYIDLLAERVTTLGGTALGTVQVVAQSSKMAAYPLDIAAGVDHVEALSVVLAGFGKAVRAAIDRADELGDAGTADIFTEISRGIDKDLWFVEAHVQADR